MYIMMLAGNSMKCVYVNRLDMHMFEKEDARWLGLDQVGLQRASP